MIWRNIFSVGVNFSFYYTVKLWFHGKIEYNHRFPNLNSLLLNIYVVSYWGKVRSKIFREINTLAISLVKTLLSRNFCQKCVRVNFSQCSAIKWKIYSDRKNISSNHLFGNFFSRNVDFTKFLAKMRESKFPKLSHCRVG